MCWTQPYTRNQTNTNTTFKYLLYYIINTGNLKKTNLYLKA